MYLPRVDEFWQHISPSTQCVLLHQLDVRTCTEAQPSSLLSDAQDLPASDDILLLATADAAHDTLPEELQHLFPDQQTMRIALPCGSLVCACKLLLTPFSGAATGVFPAHCR